MQHPVTEPLPGAPLPPAAVAPSHWFPPSEMVPGAEEQGTIGNSPPTLPLFPRMDCQRWNITNPSETSFPAAFAHIPFHSSLPRIL